MAYNQFYFTFYLNTFAIFKNFIRIFRNMASTSPNDSNSNQSIAGNENRFESILNTRLEEDEQFMDVFDYLSSGFKLPSDTTEQSLKIALEDREIELNQQYLEEFEKINDRVQSFVSRIQDMSSICHEMTERIQSNKKKTRELLKKTAVLQNEKKELATKQIYLDDFFSKYSLNSDEEAALQTGNQITLNDNFFKALKRLLEVKQNCQEKLVLEPDNFALREMSQLLTDKLESAYASLYSSIQRECRLLNVEFIDFKPTLISSFEFLCSEPSFFEKALEDYGNARRSFVVRSFIEILTRGGKLGSHKPIEQLSTDPLRYVNEMLGWIQQTISNEKEMLETLLRGCNPLIVNADSKQFHTVLTSISGALCQPLRLRIEQCITKEGNCLILYRLSNLLLYFAENYREMLPPEAHLLVCCRDLHELCSNMFYSSISSAMQRILGNARVPDYDLMPVNSVNQALLLLRDILESQNDGTLSVIMDKREIYNKIFMHILDPLMQSINLVCSTLDNHLDVAVYMLNCLNAIRSLVILYQYTDTKLEMLKAQIEVNEDVLVSEQVITLHKLQLILKASQILIVTDTMELYTKAQAHQINQGPLSKISGMEPGRVRDSIARFNQFLQSPDNYNCSQLAKVSSARIRDSIQKRTYQHVVGAYQVIFQKLSDPANNYPTNEQMKPVEEVNAILMK